MSALFEFVDVHVRVEDAIVLSDVSTTIPGNTFTVVAGVSGSGKTSLLRLCNRLDIPTTGRIMFRGDDLETIDPQTLRRRVGMVFQRPVLFAGTVRDNLMAADGVATDEALIEALAQVELNAGFLDRIGDDLSGGEAQRVCLARALMCRPEVLLMDEPTASLHPAASKTLETTVLRLNAKSNVDVIWVTHDLDQIERLAQTLVVLASGRVIYAGDPRTDEAVAALATLSERQDG
ncbi:MAG: ATP-binding cassette domain-containing protein [Actinomycetota bacterium]|nr:ATP-binding cassette domain-containing protein [Actinomycetota bacterium]